MGRGVHPRPSVLASFVAGGRVAADYRLTLGGLASDALLYTEYTTPIPGMEHY